MSSYCDPRRRSSLDIPPTMGSSLKRLQKEFIELYNTDPHGLQESMSKLSNISTKYSANCCSAEKGSKDGTGSVIAGTVITGVGLALAPFTLGISAVVAGAGAAVVAGGGIGEIVWFFKNKKWEKKFIKDLRAELNTFQNKLIPMSNKMKELHQCAEEMLKDLKSPEQCVGYLEKHFVSAAELRNFIRIYDAGGLVKNISETVRLTGTITGTLTDTSTDAEIKQLYDECVTVMNKIETTKISLGH